MSNSDAVAARTKDEGNKLFASKQYSQALDKYSKALRIGGDNAIIFANRSACQLFLGRFVLRVGLLLLQLAQSLLPRKEDGLKDAEKVRRFGEKYTFPYSLDQAIELDPSYVKAYGRLGAAEAVRCLISIAVAIGLKLAVTGTRALGEIPEGL